MKKTKPLAALMILVLLGGCAENQADRTSAPTAPPDETTAPVTTAETSVTTELNRSETLEYRGDGIIDAASFEIFDQYFYGNWVYSGEHPEWEVWDVELGYSNDISRYATDVLKDIYLDSGYAYLVLYTVMGDLVYTVPVDQPDVMYQYDEVFDYASRAREDYSYSYTKQELARYHQTDVVEGYNYAYTKQELTEDDTLGYFGIRRMLCLENEIPQDVLIPHTLKTGDGKSWVNFWEKITVIFHSETEITLKILCRADDGRNPFTPGYETPLETTEVLYTIKRNGDEWTVDSCDYANEILEFPFEETYLASTDELYRNDPLYPLGVSPGAFLDTLDDPEGLKECFIRTACAVRLFVTDHIDDPHAQLFSKTSETLQTERYPEGNLYFRTGYTYDSFYRALTSALTEETAQILLDRYGTFYSRDGELWMLGTMLGGSLYNVVGWEYELLSQTEDEVSFRRIRYMEEDAWTTILETNEPVYDPAKKDEYDVEYDDCKFVKTADGWRAEEYLDIRADGIDTYSWF